MVEKCPEQGAPLVAEPFVLAQALAESRWCVFRAGRTGRCGAPGFVFSLVQSKDVAVSQAVKQMVAEGMAPILQDYCSDTDGRSRSQRKAPGRCSFHNSPSARTEDMYAFNMIIDYGAFPLTTKGAKDQLSARFATRITFLLMHLLSTFVFAEQHAVRRSKARRGGWKPPK